jgi:hypothetical protein
MYFMAAYCSGGPERVDSVKPLVERGLRTSALRRFERRESIVYPQIAQISADKDLLRADKEKESVEICVICG